MGGTRPLIRNGAVRGSPEIVLLGLVEWLPPLNRHTVLAAATDGSMAAFRPQVHRRTRTGNLWVEVTTIEAPDEVGARLELADNDNLVVVRRRLFLVDDEPVQLATVTIPARWSRGRLSSRAARSTAGFTRYSTTQQA